MGSGDTVTFTLTEASDGQFTPSRDDPFATFDPSRLMPLNGPIHLVGAEPGDTVELEFLELVPEGTGWTAVLPGLGLLADQFTEPHLHHWDLAGRADGADFLGAAIVPIRPFCGVVGVCPAGPEIPPMMPPGRHGGNLDCRDLTAGSSLFLPVQVPGALVSLGDPHAAQGDGELCVSAIEASLSGAMVVRLHKRSLPGPQYRTPGHRPDGQGYHVTTGIGPDPMAAARDATSAMIDHLGSVYGLDPIDAYVLSSVAVDLRFSEVVCVPNVVVSAYLPLSIMNG